MGEATRERREAVLRETAQAYRDGIVLFPDALRDMWEDGYEAHAAQPVSEAAVEAFCRKANPNFLLQDEATQNAWRQRAREGLEAARRADANTTNDSERSP